MSLWISPRAVLGFVSLAAVAGLVIAQEKQAPPAKAAQPEAKPTVTHPGFEKLKQLAGEWVAADGSAMPMGEKAEMGGQGEKKSETPAKKDAAQTVAVYKVVSAGSAVQETLFPGTPHEMITMYYLDGPDLVLTHYCALANQPHMKAEKSADESKLVFKFAGGSNIDPAKDTHMHDLTLTFIASDHIRAEWALYEQGKPSDVKPFELKRK